MASIIEKTKHSFLMGLTLIWISHLFMDFMLGVWPVYKTVAQLDLIVAGLIATLGIVIGDGIQLYFGYLSDRGYQQRILTLGIALASTIPFIHYIDNPVLLSGFVLCTYIGSGAFHPSGNTLVMSENISRRSFFIALFASGGMVGAALSQIVYTYLYHHFPQYIWFLSLPIFACTIGCLLFPFSKNDKEQTRVTFRDILKGLESEKFKLILLYIIHIFLQIVVTSFTFLLPDILMLKGYESWFCLGGGYFCFIMGSVITSIPSGYCVDKVGYRLVLMAIVAVSTLTLSLFLAVDSLLLILPISLLSLLGGTMGVIVPVVVSGGIQNVPPYTRSFVSGLYMGGTTCIAGLGPIFSSLLASFFGSQGPIAALQILSLLFIISLVLIYYLPSTVPISSSESEGPQVVPIIQGE